MLKLLIEKLTNKNKLKYMQMEIKGYKQAFEDVQVRLNGSELDLRAAVGANERLKAILEEVREQLHKTASTPAEREFIAICADIHKNGKHISPRRFNATLSEIKRERGECCVDRKWGDS